MCATFPGFRSPFGRLTLAAWLALFAVAVPRNGWGAEPGTTAWFEGLRARHLYKAVETYCIERLKSPRLSDDERIDLSTELAAALADHAAFASAGERDQFWQRAEDVLSAAAPQVENDPRRVWIEAHRALVLGAAGTWNRWESELQEYDAGLRETALRSLVRALDQLERSDAALGETLKKPIAGRPAWQWRLLQIRVRLAAGTAAWEQAVLLPSANAERSELINRAEERLKAAAQQTDFDAAAWQARILIAACARLRADATEALARIEALERRDPPPDAVLGLAVERARVNLAARRPEAAVRLLDERLKPLGVWPGELAVVQAQALAMAWRLAIGRGDQDSARAMRAELKTLTDRLETHVGGFWADRARLVVDAVSAEEQYGLETAPLLLAAEAAYRRQQLPAAIRQFGEAAATALRAGRSDQAFEIAYRRASVQVQSGAWDEAAAALGELIAALPTHPRAAEADLLRIYALGRLYEASATHSRREAYTQALEHHRRAFPQSTTAGEAIWLQARLEERRRQWTAALKLYAQISESHPRAGGARAGETRCYEHIFRRLKELGKPPGDWLEALRARSAVLVPSGETPLSGPQADIAVRLARIAIEHEPPDYVSADTLLARVLAGLGEPAEREPDSADGLLTPGQLRDEAARLRIVSLAAQGRSQAASELLDRLSESGPADLLRVLDGLAQLAAASSLPADQRRELAELQIRSADRLNQKRSALSEAERLWLDSCIADAALQSGQSRRAIALYTELVKAHAADLGLQARYAQALERAGDRGSLETASTAWRTVEAGRTPGTEPWLEARIAYCRTQVALGQQSAVCKLLKKTRLLYPQLGTSAQRQQVEQLLSGCP